MELVLNLAWVLLSAFMFSFWLRLSSRTGANRRTQFAALAVLLVILFPVISVTDDLQAMQNPAETDCLLRRGHACSAPHSILPAVADLPLPLLGHSSFGFQRMAAPGMLATPVFEHPAMGSIENRPPPAA